MPEHTVRLDTGDRYSFRHPAEDAAELATRIREDGFLLIAAGAKYQAAAPTANPVEVKVELAIMAAHIVSVT